MKGTGRGGFTLVELVVVLVVAGILSATALGVFVSRRGVDAPAYAAQVRALVRFGQKVAIAQNRPVFVSISGARIGLCFDPGCSQQLAAPGGAGARSSAALAACAGSPSWYCEAHPAGLAVASSAASMYFDAQGRPFAGGDSTSSDVSTFATLAMTIGSGALAETVIIERETGFVH